MQIFANSECTEYADGSNMPVYARINTPIGFNDGWEHGDYQGSGPDLIISTPSDEYPSDEYQVVLWVDFSSQGFNSPFVAGQVVEINGDSSGLPVTNPTVIFTKP